MIEEINKNEIINFVKKFRFILLLKFKIIVKIPEKISSNNALVSLELCELNGWGYSIPNRYPDIFVINFIW